MTLIRRLRIILGFSLLGAVLAGVVLSRLKLGFDIHIPGAIAGSFIGFLIQLEEAENLPPTP